MGSCYNSFLLKSCCFAFSTETKVQQNWWIDEVDEAHLDQVFIQDLDSP